MNKWYSTPTTNQWVIYFAQSIGPTCYPSVLWKKKQKRIDDEQQKPLQQYRDEELAKMKLNFYGFDPSYHVARYHFVYKLPKARTPSYLAKHRVAGY